MKKITVIMPFLNEGPEPVNTLRSLYETSDSEDFSVIVIDDASEDEQDPHRFDSFPDVTYIRNEERQGNPACLNKGIELVQTPYVLIIDAHMRFLNDRWMKKVLAAVEESPNTIFCTVSIGVDNQNPDSFDPDAHFTQSKHCGGGCRLITFNIEEDNPNIRFILDPRWIKIDEEKGEVYEVPVVMGANYFASTEWLRHLRGFQGLKMFGSSEEYISLKSWLAGGSVKLLANTAIGHMYRSGIPVPYSISQRFKCYNKLFIAYTLFDDDTSYNLMEFALEDPNYKDALKLISENILEVEEYRKYFRSIFTRDVKFLEEQGIVNLNKDQVIRINEKTIIKKQKERELEVIDIQEKEYKRQLEELPSLIGTLDPLKLKNIEENLLRRFKKFDEDRKRIRQEIEDINFYE